MSKPLQSPRAGPSRASSPVAAARLRLGLLGLLGVAVQRRSSHTPLCRTAEAKVSDCALDVEKPSPPHHRGGRANCLAQRGPRDFNCDPSFINPLPTPPRPAPPLHRNLRHSGRPGPPPLPALLVYYSKPLWCVVGLAYAGLKSPPAQASTGPPRPGASAPGLSCGGGGLGLASRARGKLHDERTFRSREGTDTQTCVVRTPCQTES